MEYAPLAPDAGVAVSRALAGKAHGISVATSGSTGEPREVLLSTHAMLASAHATHAALHGPGAWLLALPSDRIAGAMVLVRSRVAEVPATALPGGPFTAEAFARATELLPRGLPRYTSLVPTQLERLLDSSAGRDAITAYDAVLVGGAALHAEDAPPVVVRTYGATETCGGCVYDGVPIGDTRITVRGGVVHVAGASLADGYADGDDSRFVTEGATRWFVTSDLGEADLQGRLRILGRADDVIITGGVKVAPAPVEAALAALPWIAEAVVVPVPDPEWGQAVVALVTARPGLAAPAWESDRAHLARELSREQIPRAIHVVENLPRLSSGKIDRAAAALIGAGRTQEQGATWPG